MIHPTLNINGSSRDDLIEPRIKAYDLLQAAVEQLRHVVPNGRDYPGDSERCTADRQYHYARCVAIKDIALELLLEATAIKTGD